MSFINILLLSLISLTISGERLVFLATHFRHGARAPQGYIDEKELLDYALEKWDTPGELTGMGQRMHYLLGLRNREKYITKKQFLSQKFDPHEILIYSSSLNRTLLSAASQLQGLYPMKDNCGEKLDTPHKRENAIPKVELSPEIKAHRDSLVDQALPNYMTLAPVRMISPLEKKIIIYDIPKCLFRRDEWREYNYKNLKTLQDIVTQFKNDFLPKLNESYYKYKKTYDIHFIDSFCDGIIAGYTEGKDLNVLNTAGIDKEVMASYCYNFSALNFRDWISGDDNRTLATLEVSKLMRDFIHYMRQRVEIDKKNEDEKTKANKKDYSKPKMMMISGHDSTISTLEMFFAKVFWNNNATDFYRYPYFATQVALEVTIDDTIPREQINDSNYIIKYYFNDESVLNITMDKFIKEVEPALWTDEYIDEYCKFNNKTDPEPAPAPQPESDPKKSVYFYLTIAFSITTGLILIALIIVIIKCRKKSSETINNTGLLLKNYDSN